MSDIGTTYDAIAELWHNEHQSDDWWIYDTERFLCRLRSNPLILDVGCGSGVKAAYLIARGARVHGIDVSKEMLAIAARTAPHALFMHLDMRKVDLLQWQTYDGIFAQASLLHIPHKEVVPVLKALHGRLAEHGILYLAVKAQRKGEPHEVVIPESYGELHYERFFSYYTKENLRAYLAEAGFVVNSLEFSHRWLHAIARKA
ncbi:hypothetical protein A3C89_03115 [Candidatus Kaiserbacteria bacterium RIFCSPHIGHO2_02_FULL_50_50]|uniref:Methyltransferase domain-containing protein n=1 Tax=Candidatus Kaiserbacteria bacterium RIFCSPHIGHO2_02_FULL_50_50 TaxID=1798492 RepID=A0A1F6DEW3_9BACT|nr:MAG: hypothetical protein A3C89_03115 [Candidatus Kaiserbacteria bacterium RIFCSPHIGHO2_02_FULL_50_50]OGG89087.1 MAG: hypothetical protein A3G62_02145 [Candidatus Kaiserbacteria bacterium RIFCSPLOWO2_12_FULL_50_10]